MRALASRPPRYWAGGTCGNVLTALAYLGWRTLPVARLQPGAAADRIRQDLKAWGVSDRYDYFIDDDNSIQTGEDFLWDSRMRPTPAVDKIRQLLR